MTLAHEIRSPGHHYQAEGIKTRSFWADPANQARLEEGIAAGLTAQAIGTQLGITKNAVIGRCKRKKLRLKRERGRNIAYDDIEIKRLAGEGKTMHQIAALTGISYDCIRHRKRILGIKIEPGYNQYNGKGKKIRKRSLLGFDLHKPTPPTREERNALDQAIPVSQRKTLLTLRERDCRWPVGNPGDEDFFYCGAPAHTGHSYCPTHCIRAYQP